MPFTCADTEYNLLRDYQPGDFSGVRVRAHGDSEPVTYTAFDMTDISPFGSRLHVAFEESGLDGSDFTPSGDQRAPAVVRERSGGAVAHIALAVSVALLMVMTAACGIREEFHEPKITNTRDQTIEIYIDSGGVVTKLATVAAGTTVGLSGFNNRCTQDPMVARTVDGIEVARRDEPICPDEFWTIQPQP